MSDIVPGQRQLFAAEPSAQRFSAENIPKYEDVVLTAEQIEQAALEWPTRPVYRKVNGKRVKDENGKDIVEKWVPTTQEQQIASMKMRVLNQMRHEIILDPITGRRAFGGVQRGSGGPKKKRLDEMLIDEAESRSRDITDALFSALERGVDPAVRHKAAINIMREARAVHEQAQRDDELDRASKEEIMDLAVSILTGAVRSGDLSPADFDLTEADVIELESDG